MVIAAPRGHSKSTCLSEHFPLQEIVRDSNIRILIVSKTLDQAQLHLRTIKARIERDNDYREYAGVLVPKYPNKWTDREIIINRTNLELKDATVSTVGIGGSILTRRADVIICDDILGPENTRTAEQRANVKTFFYEVLLPVLEPRGRVIFMGTKWHKADLLGELLEDASYDFRKTYRAIIHEPGNEKLWEQWYKILISDGRREAEDFMTAHTEEMYKGVDVLWAERFPYDLLFSLRKQNKWAFEKAYQNNIISSEEQEIKDEWIRYYDSVPDKAVIFAGTGVDLAISEKETADYTAMVSGKLALVGEKLKVYVMPNPFNERVSQYKTIENAKSISLSLGGMHLTPLWVEDVAYQKAAIGEMQRAGLPAESVKISSDKRARLRVIAPYLENGTVEFPKKGCENLIYQLLGFGQEAHDDLVDAFVYMVYNLVNLYVNQPKLTII